MYYILGYILGVLLMIGIVWISLELIYRDLKKE